MLWIRHSEFGDASFRLFCDRRCGAGRIIFRCGHATLEKGASPVVTSERVGLPKPWQPDPIQTLVSKPAPEPDMTTPEVLAAQPKTAAEAPKKKHVTRKRSPDDHYQQNQAWSRDRDRGPFGFFFGRF